MPATTKGAGVVILGAGHDMESVEGIGWGRERGGGRGGGGGSTRGRGIGVEVKEVAITLHFTLMIQRDHTEQRDRHRARDG